MGEGRADGRARRAVRQPGLARRLAPAAGASLAFHAVLAAILVVVGTDGGRVATDASRVPLRMVDREGRPVAEAGTAAIATEATAEDEAPANRSPAPRTRTAERRTPEAATATEAATTPSEVDTTPPPVEPPVASPRQDEAAPAGGGAVPAPGTAVADGGGDGGPGGGSGGSTRGPGASAGGPGSGSGGTGRPGGPWTAADRGAPPDPQALWAQAVSRRFQEASRFPESSFRSGRYGRVVLKIRVEADGRLASTAVDEASEWPELNRVALAAASRVGVLPAPPDGLPREVRVPLDFTKRRP